MSTNPPSSTTVAEAGRTGPDIRSDCWVKITLGGSGLNIQLKTKVESMYGQATRELFAQGAEVLGIKDATIEVDDTGALPFVLMARLEAAVRRLGIDVGTGWLPEMMAHCQYPTERERFRRSRLYLPGNESKFMLNAGLHKPDAVILDLEDSVAVTEKDAARLMVRNALRTLDFQGSERTVRINQGDRGIEDLEYIVPHNVHLVLIPKVERVEHVQRVDARIQELRQQHKLEQPVLLMPIIESALGAIKAYDIATCSENIVALSIGLEDYTADIGVPRTDEGRESFWARCQVVNAARAAGVQPIDTVYSDVANMEGLREAVLEAKALGFDGKGCIHPRQIPVVHEAYAPSEAELDRARKIVAAFEEAEAKGLAAVSLGSKMIDPPVVKRAIRVVKLAEAMGL